MPPAPTEVAPPRLRALSEGLRPRLVRGTGPLPPSLPCCRPGQDP